ncbi:MAG TPA: DUF1015 domain-containing protein [Acidobacteriaceae bacterium]|nr:DUF1015 domain-containing protein [Acidobacteriaceae bacterium]
MARIFPFRALRYNPLQVRLKDVVTQPYDKITPAMQQAYYQRSPYNLVRILLGLPELFDGKGAQDVYRRAADDFTAWKRDGILTQESEPCIYAYSQTFRISDTGTGQETHYERRGFIALGELSEYADKVVFRHEQTLSRPKSDRLNLLKATHAHFGQIFMLYSDPGLTADRLLFHSTAAPDIEVTDEYEVVHRVWRVGDPAVINLMTTALEDKKLIIADGHHRYETALQYAREHAPDGGGSPVERTPGAAPQPAYPESAAMMTFVNMDQPGLLILPTHRVVYGLDGFEPGQFAESVGPYFTVEALAENDPAALVARLRSEVGKAALVAVTAAGSFLLTAIPGAAETALKDVPERQRGLDVVQLHRLILEKALGITPEAVAQQSNLRYVRDAAEAAAQVARNEADVAFLMNPLTLNALREVAFAGEVLPQKSTDFYPKLLSGLTIYAMD